MIVEELSSTEQRIAACTSYAYWAYEMQTRIHTQQPTTTTTNPSNSDDDNDNDKSNSSSIMIRMAMREAYRHYIGQNYQYDNTVRRLKQTIQWRMETQIDLLKLSFTASIPSEDAIQRHTIGLSNEEITILNQYETVILSDLHIQPMVVRGMDTNHRPIIVRQSRQRPWSSIRSSSSTGSSSDGTIPQQNDDHDTMESSDTTSSVTQDDITMDRMEQGFQWAQLYMAERAIAIAEMESFGTRYQISAFFDYTQYNSNHAPPMSVLIQVIVSTLQAHYPERLGKAVFINAPFWTSSILNIISPLLPSKTRAKLLLLGSSSSSLTSWLPTTSSIGSFLWRPFATSATPEASVATISESMPNRTDDDDAEAIDEVPPAAVCAIVDAEQAMPFMRSDGRLLSPIDILYQLQQVPFFHLYDFKDTTSKTAETLHP
jgi:CRAL/TRIO domain